MNPRKGFVRYMSDDGTATGAYNMAVNGAVTPVEYWFDASDRFSGHPTIRRSMWFMADSANWSADNWADLAGPLTNGVKLEVHDADGNVLLDLLGGAPLTTNAEWGRLMYDASLVSYGAGEDFLTGRYSFDKFMNGGLTLGPGEILVATIQDDLSTVSEFTILLEGYYA